MVEKIKSMTLAEKVAQLKGFWLRDLMEDDELSLEKCRELIPDGIGHICQYASSNAYEADKLAKIVSEVQEYIQNETKQKIPVMFHEEIICGVAAKGATATPQMIGMACSFNPSLVAENARNAATNLKKIGGYYALSPMMDVITNANWARLEEGFGEDSYMVSVFADAFIRTAQSEGIATTAKHYAGYGVANQEEDFFINETLFPFEVAVRKSKVEAVMPGYHEFRGVKASYSIELLIDSLRNHLGFDRLVVSDYNAIKGPLKNDLLKGAELAMNASIDVDLPAGANYEYLEKLVEMGRITEQQIDAAVKRVLDFKEKYLPKNPTVAEKNINLDDGREQALKSARESIVLLSNNGILPLKNKDVKILVTGPNADSCYSLLGDYTWGGLAEFFRKIPIDRNNPRLVTLNEGLKTEGFKVEYERGFNWVEVEEKAIATQGGDAREEKANRKPLEKVAETNFAMALSKAKNADLIIVGVGENRYLCGEGSGRKGVDLPGKQEEYVSKLAETGKPVIMVVFGGRPMVMSRLAEKCAAIIYAWYPGEEGGTALAEIISGKVNPTAKLAVTIPNNNAEVPVCLKDTDREQMFPFGYGLSYTEYEYKDFTPKIDITTEDEYFDISYSVKNIGDMDGAEITQCYFEINGVKKLLGFTKTFMESQEEKQISMRFYLDQFGRYENGEFIIRPGEYKLMIGASASDIKHNISFEIKGDSLKKDSRANYFSEII
ncbi:MAG: hypothetical protein ATN31_08435 [Candidatus Epulonipiscioides saccharophilum]|nr:MAG: hypothetical protein ATN31_08435 [Epulopiscium sp. AS2M-Bin001]